MFVFSFKTSRKKIIFFSVILVCVVSIYAVSKVNDDYSISVLSSSNFSVKAVDNSSRIEFLSSFGWKVNTEPIEISEITIPQEFNSVYQNYNQIQKEQGFNLEKYRGKLCKHFTYRVLNYKDQDLVNANLIVYKNKIIGGDISSVELSGFMHGFKNPGNCINTQAKVNWTPSESLKSSNSITRTTYRENLDPDPNMQNAPTD